MNVVRKPWGYELWFAHTDKYAGKLIFFNKGYKGSLHYHVVKHETIYLDSGLVNLTLEDENHDLMAREFRPGDAFVILPGRKHQVEAIEDSRIIEVSTPELDDVVRVDDIYGRLTTQPSQKSEDKR